MKQIADINRDTRELFSYSALQYMMDAFHENPSIGKVFVDAERAPQFGLLQIRHLVFIGGEFSLKRLQYVKDYVKSHEMKENTKVCYIFYPDREWKRALEETFEDNAYHYERSLYARKPGDIKVESDKDEITFITDELVNSPVENLDMIFEEVLGTGTYSDMEDFLQRGIGVAPILDNKVCGFCTSEFPSKKAVAIGIEVTEDYQKKGLAKAMTQSFLEKAAERELHVYWECWKENVASAKTAKSCGFEKVADYPMFFIKL